MHVSCVLRGTGATPDDSGFGESCVAKRAVYFSGKGAPVPNPPRPSRTTPDRTAESEGGMCCWQTHPQLKPLFRLTVNPAASAEHWSPAKSASSRASKSEGSPAASAEDGSPAKSASSRTSNSEGEAAAGVQKADYAEELVDEFTSPGLQLLGLPRDDLNVLFARADVWMCGRQVLQRPLSRGGNSTSKCRPKASGHMHFLSVQQ